MKIAFNARGIENLFSIGDKKSDVMDLNLKKIGVDDEEYDLVRFFENHVVVFFHEDKITRIRIKLRDDDYMFVYKENNRSIIFSNKIDPNRFFKVNKDVFYPIDTIAGRAYTNRGHTVLIMVEDGGEVNVIIHAFLDYSKLRYQNRYSNSYK